MVISSEPAPETTTESEYTPWSARVDVTDDADFEEAVEELTSGYVAWGSRAAADTVANEDSTIDPATDEDCGNCDSCECDDAYDWEDEDEIDSLTDEQRGVGSVYFPASDEEDQGDYIPYNQRFGITSGFVPCSQLVDVVSTPEPVIIDNGTEEGYTPYSQLKVTVG